MGLAAISAYPGSGAAGLWYLCRMDWKTQARKARSLLKEAPHGGREAVLRTEGFTGGVNTIRRWAFAMKYLERLKREAPAVHGSVSDAPFSSVETLARWASLDWEAALRGAEELTAGRKTRADLLDSLAAAKQSAKKPTGESLATGYRARLKDSVPELVRNIVGGMITDASVNYREDHDPPVDFKLLRVGPDGRTSSVIVLVVGPYQNGEIYRKRVHDWVFRALAFAWVHGCVVMLLPDPSQVDLYRRHVDSLLSRGVLRKRSRKRVPPKTPGKRRSKASNAGLTIHVAPVPDF